MLHHLANATKQVANKVHFNCHPQEDGNKRVATTTESTHSNGQQSGAKVYFTGKIFALYSAVVKTHSLFPSRRGYSTQKYSTVRTLKNGEQN